jgi:hypothetical protein
MRGTTKPTSKNDAIASFEGDRRRLADALGDADHWNALGEVIDLRRARASSRGEPKPREVFVNAVNDVLENLRFSGCGESAIRNSSADAVCPPADE